MYVIEARDVNDAYKQGVALLRRDGLFEETRAGTVLVMPCPVTTVYERPQQRVLLCPKRDANPFFHLFEALHMLAGRNDARWLDRFVHDFSSRFAEDDGHQHGAYGYRWRRHFDMEGGGAIGFPDQLDTIVCLLRKNSQDRRIVLQMWDPVADLGAAKRDIPCNTTAYFRVREEKTIDELSPPAWRSERRLDLTVCCRSNDIVWGAYGANAVHFSVLQEYVAGRLGIQVGRYYQISNNFHGYVSTLDRVGEPAEPAVYPGVAPMGTDWERWDEDLASFMAWTEGPAPDQERRHYHNGWFSGTAEPLFVAYTYWRRGGRSDALRVIHDVTARPTMAPDWRAAAGEWFERRIR